MQWSLVTAAPTCTAPAGVGFSFHPPEPLVQATVHFSASVLSGTAPFTYSWALGDGGTAAGAYPSHAFALPAVYTVTLQVSNACGSGSNSQPVLVSPYRIYLPLVSRLNPARLRGCPSR